MSMSVDLGLGSHSFLMPMGRDSQAPAVTVLPMAPMSQIRYTMSPHPQQVQHLTILGGRGSYVILVMDGMVLCSDLCTVHSVYTDVCDQVVSWDV